MKEINQDNLPYKRKLRETKYNLAKEREALITQKQKPTRAVKIVKKATT